jgi:hypothetical protein
VSLRDLLILYGVVGLGCAIAAARRQPVVTGRAAGSALATMLLWPLWAPFSLGAQGLAAPRSGRGHPSVRRCERALDEAASVVAGTPMSDVFSQKAAARIRAEVTRVAARLDELSASLARAGFDPVASARRLAELEASGAPQRVVATARMQHDSLSRLAQIHTEDAQALEELADLLDALRAQLMLARYSGSPAEGAGAIVGEVWARLEGLGAAFDVAG